MMAKSTYPIFNHDPRIIEEGQARAEQALILEAAQLREDVKRQMAIANEHANEVERLRAVIGKAPHDEDCAGWERLRTTDGNMLVFDNMDETNCDCWKRTALEKE